MTRTYYQAALRRTRYGQVFFDSIHAPERATCQEAFDDINSFGPTNSTSCRYVVRRVDVIGNGWNERFIDEAA